MCCEGLVKTTPLSPQSFIYHISFAFRNLTFHGSCFSTKLKKKLSKLKILNPLGLCAHIADYHVINPKFRLWIWLNSALSPIVYGDIALSVNT